MHFSFLLLIGSLLLQQSPAWSPPAERSAEQAQVDVCLFTPAESRDPSCGPLLQTEAALVPDEGFSMAQPTAFGWADIACAPDRLPPGQDRAACRDEQRRLFRRAERARQALHQGQADGVLAQEWVPGSAAQSGAPDDPASAFTETSRPVGDNCRQRQSQRHDQDTGDRSSSHSFSCSYGDPEMRQELEQTLQSLFEND